jgi:Asp-tRNA(Asn)/Glu-tRNA(Gln) amidotransferase A subunit family amidase
MIKARAGSARWPALIVAAGVVLVMGIAACAAKASPGLDPAGPPSSSVVEFKVLETTISGVQAAFREGRLTARRLVAIYLQRIEKYDKPTGLNAVVVVNPDAERVAAELDAEFARTRKLRPLHGIPVIVKDNYKTRDLQTTGGSIALKGLVPPDDAFQVRRLREAGAVVLGKSNMGEWAFSPYETVSSILGVTRNPYDLGRVPAGSSGGTAASVAANLALAGLGTDTGNSIRGPSSHCGLAGIRSTIGLTSRDGIIPLYLRNDIGGPMARTVEDAVRILDIIAGYDPADPVTERSKGKIPEGGFVRFLDKDGLRGARIGVFRSYTDTPTADSEIKALFARAVEEMRARGAVIVDPFVIPEFAALTKDLWCDAFHHDVNAFLASLGDGAPFKTLRQIFDAGLYAPNSKGRIARALATDPNAVACRDLYQEPKNIVFRQAVEKAMDAAGVDVIIYPTWSNPPREIGDLKSPAGDNSQLIPPHTGFPAMSVPMGYSRERLPAGLQVVARLFAEPTLIRVAFAYEQATRHRRPPAGFD